MTNQLSFYKGLEITVSSGWSAEGKPGQASPLGRVCGGMGLGTEGKHNVFVLWFSK